MGEKVERLYHLLIPHPTEPAVLMLANGSNWALPQCSVDARTASAAEPIRAAVRAQLGLGVIVLRCVTADHDEPAHQVTALFDLDNLSPDWTLPPSARWVDAAALAGLPLAETSHRRWLEAWFAESGSPPTLRAPWARPGWFGEACAWIEAQVQHEGWSLSRPIEQLRLWSITCALRMRTSAGDLYFKAVPEMFAREPGLTRALGELFSDCVPEVVAMDAARGWMLLRDFGGRRLSESADPTAWEAALRRYARLQIESARDLDHWFALDCLDRRPAQLAMQIDPLLADKDALLLDQPDGLTSADLGTLRGLSDRLKAACAALADLGLPDTLEHGDFHADNINVTERGPVIYDWTDGCVAHPFFSLASFSETAPPELFERVVRAYLDEWATRFRRERVEAAFRLARPLGALHLAVSYQIIRDNTEPGARWELAGALPFWLKVLLKHRDKL